MEIRPATPDTWTLAARLLKNGRLVVFPTDTVYGIGCDANNPTAISAIYNAKGRSALKAIPLLMAGEDVLPLVSRSVSPVASDLAAAHWPGALTLVVERQPDLPGELGGGASIAVRVPAHEGLRGFIRECGGFIAATSANLSGQPDALDAEAAAEYFGDSVALVVNGGTVTGGIPSTVVDCTIVPPVILREGAVSASAIGETIDAANC